MGSRTDLGTESPMQSPRGERAVWRNSVESYEDDGASNFYFLELQFVMRLTWAGKAWQNRLH